MNGFLNQFPYSDFHEMNLDWILKAMKQLAAEMNDFEAANSVSNEGFWDTTKQYTSWSIVQYGEEAYISLKPVPSGISIDNTEYWKKVGSIIVDHSLNAESINAIANSVVTSNFESVRDDIRTLQTNVDNETTARIDGDALLTNTINSMNDSIQNQITGVIDITSNQGTIISQNRDMINELDSRVDQIIALPDGSTKADAELIDIRIGANGVNYNSAGDAVRGQFKEVNNKLDEAYHTGTNICDVNTPNKWTDIVITNTNGSVMQLNNYTSVLMPVDVTKGSISVNTTYSYIIFLSAFLDLDDTHIGQIPDQYISGVLAQATPLADITIPLTAKFVLVSTGTNKISTLQVQYGASITPYEPYQMGIDGDIMFDNSIPLSKLEGDLPSYDFDSSLYALPYIKDCRVVCNTSSITGTAYYAGVDSKGTPNKIISKFIMEAGTNSGTVALISQKNGLNQVSDITNKSFHVVITATSLAVNLFLDGQYYSNPIATALTNYLLMDGTTENTVIVEISGNDISVKVNNDTYTGTFVDPVYDLDYFIGRYVQFEHFCNGNREDFSMPMFTYWEVSGSDIFIPIKDNFSRPDGLLYRTPTGYEYHVFTNVNSGY